MNRLNLNNPCIVTESSNDSFHKTKIAILSYLHYNISFDGDIIVLVHNTEEFNDIHIKTLEELPYPVKIVKVDPIDDDLNNLKVYAFNIDAPIVTYFSQDSLFLGRVDNRNYIDDIAVASDFIIPRTVSNSFDMFKYMSIPEKHLNSQVFNDIMSRSNDNINDRILDTFDKFYIQYDNTIPTSSNESITDDKYPLFIRYSKAVKVLIIGNTNSNHRKINRFWINVNKKFNNNISNTRSHIKKNIIDLKQEYPELVLSDVEVSDKIAMYTTLNNNYIKYAITCFESFRSNSGINNLDFYIFCKDASDESREILDRHNIKLIDMDLSDKYKIPAGYPYPSECFWIFDCPSILYELGYSHSIGIDADTYCNSILDFSWLDKVKGVAGVNRGTSIKYFLDNIQQTGKLSRLFKLTQRGLKSCSINTGVLVFNNKYAHESNLAHRMFRIFDHSMKNGVPRKGDDSMFSLFLAVFDDTPVHIIDSRFNDYHFYKISSIPRHEPYIIHYGKIKPWSNKHATSKVVNYYFNKWRTFNSELKSKK